MLYIAHEMYHIKTQVFNKKILRQFYLMSHKLILKAHIWLSIPVFDPENLKNEYYGQQMGFGFVL